MNTQRDKLTLYAGVALAIISMEATAGMIYLSVIGHDVPPSLAGMATGAMMALAALITIPPNPYRNGYGTQPQPPANPPNDVSTGRGTLPVARPDSQVVRGPERLP